jgi:hypothetical protein
MSRNDYGLRFGEQKQYFGNFPDGRKAMADGGSAKGKMPARNKKNFRPTKSDYVRLEGDGNVKEKKNN